MKPSRTGASHQRLSRIHHPPPGAAVRRRVPHPTDEEWVEFLGHFERSRLSLGAALTPPCIHQHACIRCPLLRPDPAQRPLPAEIRDNLIRRIDEAQRESCVGEA